VRNRDSARIEDSGGFSPVRSIRLMPNRWPDCSRLLLRPRPSPNTSAPRSRATCSRNRPKPLVVACLKTVREWPVPTRRARLAAVRHHRQRPARGGPSLAVSDERGERTCDIGAATVLAPPRGQRRPQSQLRGTACS
jgi:hypothetical protein